MDLLALSLMGNLVVALFILLCAGLILIILLQKGRGGGLSGAFGGGAGAGSLLGTKTGDFLTWVTIALVAGFLVLAVLMGKFMGHQEASPELSLPTATAPQETPAAETDETTPTAETDTADEVAEEVAEDAAAVIEEVVDAAEEAQVEETVEAETETESTPIPAEELAEEMIN